MLKNLLRKESSSKSKKPGWVYSTKQGGRKRGSLKVGINVELVSFTEKAYFVRGKRDNGIGVSGWVTPTSFSSKDPKFVEKLKQVHARQLLVRELIEKKRSCDWNDTRRGQQNPHPPDQN